VQQLQKKGWDISQQAIYEGLSNTRKLTGLHGRWETIHFHPQVILDVAHNESGIQEVLSQLELMHYHNLHIILGMVKDKESGKILTMLPKNALYYFTRAQIPRAMQEDLLAQKAIEMGLEGEAYPNVHSALEAALLHSDKDDLILVCGSVFLVGEVDSGKLNFQPG
jgi:dihydrofolate synthase/folylpolyglutamate synthase